MREAGHRCIAPDYPGFGRSDKPTDIDWYSYDRHFEFMAKLLCDELDLRDATAVVHDWGGPIGLRMAAEHPDRFERIVIMDTGLFTGHQPMTDAWKAFRDFVAAHRGPADRASWSRARPRRRCPTTSSRPTTRPIPAPPRRPALAPSR